MNAMTPFQADPTTIEEMKTMTRALDDLEGKLDRIRRLADSAMTVVEHGLGRQAPASELDTILAIISETAQEAEALRAEGLAGVGPP
jgi:hypothetical protein